MTPHHKTLTARLRAAFFALCWLLAASWQTPALAQDCVIDSPAMVALPSYDPTSPAAAVAWQIKLRGVRGCQAHLQIENLDTPGRLNLAGGSSGERLQTSLLTQASGGSPVPPAPSEVGVFKLAAGQETTVLLWLRADAIQWVGAGLYQQVLGVRITRPNGATLDYRETRIVNDVRATARARFGAISDSGSGGSSVARLDFGELQQGAQRGATLEVLANTAHTLSLASSGRGRLTNRQNPSSSIAWNLRINGQPVPLASGNAVLPFLARGRIRYQFDAQIGAIERVLAGDYADDLLITITAQ
jgi:hypothetical protein